MRHTPGEVSSLSKENFYRLRLYVRLLVIPIVAENSNSLSRPFFEVIIFIPKNIL